MRGAFTQSKSCVLRVPLDMMVAGKSIPEEQASPPAEDSPKVDDDASKQDAAKGSDESADKTDNEASKKHQEEQQQAVMTLIQGVAIGQTKGGCWSIKQASILNSAVKQLTGNAEPSVLPVFDPSETPAEGVAPQQRCVIYLIQAVGFGQAKGAFNLEQAAILDTAIDVLTSENKSA